MMNVIKRLVSLPVLGTVFFFLVVTFCLVNVYGPFGFKFLLLQYTLGSILLLNISLLIWSLGKLEINKLLKSVIENFLIVAMLAVVLECFFMNFDRPYQIGAPLAEKVWRYKHWETTYSGFRHIQPKDTTRDNILVLGASFTAAHGIDLIEDRFTEVATANSEDKNFVNLGWNAITFPRHEVAYNRYIDSNSLDHVKGLVLQLSGNDITQYAKRNGIEKEKRFQYYSEVPDLFKPIVRYSFLVNFIYWSLYTVEESKSTFLAESYNSDKALKDYVKEVSAFIKSKEKQNLKCYVLLLPFYTNVKGTNALFVDKMEQLLIDEGVKVISLGSAFENDPPNKLMVNKFDSHPNEYVHQIIGEKLAKELN